MAAVDLRASKTGYLTLDQAAAINASDATLAMNSDDPAYFFGHTDKYGTTHGDRPCGNPEFHGAVTHWLFYVGGYVDSCYHATARECGLTADECVLLARNSLEATFAAPEDKAALVAKLCAYCEAFSA